MLQLMKKLLARLGRFLTDQFGEKPTPPTEETKDGGPGNPTKPTAVPRD